jgi:threonine dehydrogenase-like Zn-dependent dehydrogenase
MKQMKALQIIEPGRAEVIVTAVPKPGAGQVVVEIEAVNTCPHWDIHMMAGEPMFPGSTVEYPNPPGQPGHEAIGRVVAVGSGVKDLKEGDPVASWKDQGHDRPGCYAQYNLFEAVNLLKIPDGVPKEGVISLELAMCVQVCYTKLNLLSAVDGKRLCVTGMGPAGLIAVQMAKAYGASFVTAVDPLDERRELALKMGADEVYAPPQPGVIGNAPPVRPERGAPFDSAVECTGLAPAAEFLLDRTNGPVAKFGVLRDNFTYKAWNWRRVSFLGYERHNRPDAERAMALITQEKLDLTPLTSVRLPLERYTEGTELLREKKALKVCYLPQE